MAKRSGNNRAGKGPSFKGVITVDTVRGVLRIRSKPKYRGKDTPERKEWMRKWGDNHRLWRYAPPQIQVQWIEATAGTPYYPRDIWTSFNYGKAAYFFDPVIKKMVYTVYSRSEVSKSLDSISQTEGAVLYRGKTLWEVPPSGAAGQVLALASVGTQLLPRWTAGGGGAAGVVIATVIPAAGVLDIQGLDLTPYREVELRFDEIEIDTADIFMNLRLYNDGTLVTADYFLAEDARQSNSSATTNQTSEVGSSMFLTASAAGAKLGAGPLNTLSGSVILTGFKAGQRPNGRINTVYRSSANHLWTVRGAVGLKDPLISLTGFRVFPSTNTIDGGQMTVIGR
jgi:hypothetical protein